MLSQTHDGQTDHYSCINIIQLILPSVNCSCLVIIIIMLFLHAWHLTLPQKLCYITTYSICDPAWRFTAFPIVQICVLYNMQSHNNNKNVSLTFSYCDATYMVCKSLPVTIQIKALQVRKNNYNFVFVRPDHNSSYKYAKFRLWYLTASHTPFLDQNLVTMQCIYVIIAR